MSERSATARREGVTAVHSLDHFVFCVAGSRRGRAVLRRFGLDVRAARRPPAICTRSATRIAGGRSCAAAGEQAAPVPRVRRVRRGPRRAEDRLARLGIEAGRRASAGGDVRGSGSAIPRASLVARARRGEGVAGDEVGRRDGAVVPRGAGAAPARSKARKVRPRRLSHVLMFTSDVTRSRSSTATRSGCGCPTTPARASRSCTARTAATTTCSRSRSRTDPACITRAGTLRSIDEVGLGMEQMDDRRATTTGGAWAVT